MCCGTVCVSSLVVDEIKRIVKTSEIMKEDDAKWPQKNKDGRQELEIRVGNDHISFEASLFTFPLCLRLTHATSIKSQQILTFVRIYRQQRSVL